MSSRVLSGVARKVSLVFIALSVLSWIMFVVGYALLVTQINPVFLEGAVAYPFWVIIIKGGLLIMFSVKQSIISQPSTAGKVLTTIATFFSIFYITALGMVLYITGLDIVAGRQVASTSLLFSASLFSTICRGLLMMLWPFFDYKDAE